MQNSNQFIDLRSDTVTKPSTAMWEAMCKAPLGDDVFAEDPTINKLQEMAADLFGMEAALFCPSGTMTNQIAINILTRPGDELICDASAHIYNYEGGGISLNSGVQAKLLQGDRGRLKASQVEEAINPDYDWLCKTRLVCLENTVNRSGGSVYDFTDIQAIKNVCLKHNLSFHLDGARLFNALAVSKESPKQYGQLFDTISICLSKGLGAPVGSLLLGTKAIIKDAKRRRKVFGGGMRQAGLLAAAGIFALENNTKRLGEDHANATLLGKTVQNLGFVESILPVETNIVIFTLKKEVNAAQFVNELKQHGVISSAFSGQTVRFVTHLDVCEAEILKVCEILEKLKF